MKQGQMGVSAVVSASVSAMVRASVSAMVSASVSAMIRSKVSASVSAMVRSKVSAGISAGISAMEVRRGVQAQNNKYIKCLRYITIFLFRWGFGLTNEVRRV